MAYRDELAAAQARVESLKRERDAIARERDALLRERRVRPAPASKEPQRKPRKLPSDPYLEPVVVAVASFMGIFILLGLFMSLVAC